MATFTSPTLSEEFKSKFEISDVHKAIPGGQKHVFIITRNGTKYALKIFKNYGKREARELSIYEEFKGYANLPSIHSIEDHEDDKVVFEHYIDGPNLQEIIHTYQGNELRVKKLIKCIGITMKPIWERDPSIIHRDFKPSNLIIQSDDTPAVIDFGIARDLGEESITDTGFAQPGSPRFAAPEQYLGKKDLIDYRTDFFSLAVVAYYAYYNKLPFGNTVDEIAEQYKKSPIPYASDASCGLNELFKSCFTALPAERPRNPDLLIELVS